MSSLEIVKSKAKSFLDSAEPFITRQTGSYDASKNRVIVAGITLDGVVNASLSKKDITSYENGINPNYVAVINNIQRQELTVSVLPTANCINVLYQLAEAQRKNSGWFTVSVHNNGKLVGVYRSWILSLPEVILGKEPEDMTFVFGVKATNNSVAKADKDSTLVGDNYTRFGTPAEENKNKEEALVPEDGWVKGYEPNNQ